MCVFMCRKYSTTAECACPRIDRLDKILIPVLQDTEVQSDMLRNVKIEPDKPFEEGSLGKGEHTKVKVVHLEHS